MNITPVISFPLSAVFASITVAGSSRAQDRPQTPRGPDWDAVLGAPQGEWPSAQESIDWREDLPEALAEARKSNRPLFVTLRCLPCKQCSGFDQAVLDGGQWLDPLLAQFITVRITDAAKIDMARLPVEGFQDLDLSWWGYFLSPRAELYGVFGGRDEVSDTTRISTDALARTLERVLDHHYDPRRAQWGIDRAPVAATTKPFLPRDLPKYEEWYSGHPDAKAQSCLHCHQLREALWHPLDARGEKRKRRLAAVWPLPENVGVRVERDDGLRVTHVEAGSPAAKIGLAPGDRLGAAGGRRLFGQADFRGVLHRKADPSGAIEVHWLRDGKRHRGVLELDVGWRETVLDWRMSISQGNLGADPGFFPRKGHPVRAGEMAIVPFFGKDRDRSHAYRAGLRPHHTVVAINGESPDLHGRAFLVWYRLKFDYGDRLTFTVIDQGTERKIRVLQKARG